MRIAIFLLALASVAFPLNATITRFMSLETSTSCPGNMLLMNATASDGSPATGVELRLVLYEPFQGLRALMHTDQDGLASVQLTKPGSYRVYMYTSDYDHDQYVSFDYPAMCPPPPPSQMNLTVSPQCGEGLLLVTAYGNGTPLEGVFVSVRNDHGWSSLTGSNGEASFPLEQGDVFINASRENYSSLGFYTTINCTPPECASDLDCPSDSYCVLGNCSKITGGCGFAENHTWFVYRCCSDQDCGNASTCQNHTCAVPAPPAQSNQTNLSNSTPPAKNASLNETANQGGKGVGGGCLGSILFLASVLAMKVKYF